MRWAYGCESGIGEEEEAEQMVLVLVWETPPSELGQLEGPPSEVVRQECVVEDWAPPSELVWREWGKDRPEGERVGEAVDEEREEWVVVVAKGALEGG